MRAGAERQMLCAVFTIEIELVRLLEDSRIAIRRTKKRNHCLSLLDVCAVDVEALRRQSPGELVGSVVTKHFVRRISSASRVGTEAFNLIGIRGKGQHTAARRSRSRRSKQRDQEQNELMNSLLQ